MPSHSRDLRVRLAATGLVLALATASLAPIVLGAAAAAITLSPSTASPGATVTVTGTGFDRRGAGIVTFDGSSAGMPSFTTNQSGHLTTSFVVPATAVPGSHVVRASTASTAASATLTVTLPPTPTPTPTPTPVPTAPPTPSPTAPPTPTPSPTATPLPQPTADPNDIGTRDQAYPTTVFAPTGQKPQSKLWYTAAGWWGILFDSATNRFEIYRYDWPSNAWTTTGIGVDERPGSSADALWDGSHLVVISALADESNASSPPTAGDRSVRVLQLSPAAGSWSIDPGYPVVIATAAIEAAVIDEDSTGTLWATWTDDDGAGGRNVLVTHSTTDHAQWVTPYALPVAGATGLTTDDISAVVAFRGRVGVMWSNQRTDTMAFATHVDGAGDQAWTVNPAVQGPRYADDHISLRSLAATPDGEVVAATKTSLDDAFPGSTQPLILVLTLDTQGGWHRTTFSTVQDGETRPIVVVDAENDAAYVFATANSNYGTSAGAQVNGGTIYYKSASLPNPTFTSGKGTAFLRLGPSSSSFMNNPTSTKQAVTASSGLLVLGGDDGVRQYMHNRIAIGQAPAPTPTPSPTATVTPTPTPTPTATPTPAPPIATYRFEEGSGTTIVDSSGSGNDGTTRGSPTWVTGHSGLAIHLNGTSDWCTVPSTTSLDLHGPLTLSAWVRPERLGTGYIVKKAAFGSVNGYELSLSAAGKVFVRFNQATSGDTYRINSVTSYPSDGTTWIHVAATFDGATLRLYVNGVQEGSLAAPAPASNTLAVGIGAQADGVSPFQGVIDDVGIWNRALSPAEIQGLVGG